MQTRTLSLSFTTCIFSGLIALCSGMGCSGASELPGESEGAAGQELITTLSCDQRCGQTLTSPGAAPFACSCRADCVSEGDCCADAATYCPAVTGGAGCYGSCGGPSPDGCHCDEVCVTYGDCCGDYALSCAGGRVLLQSGGERTTSGLYVDPTGRTLLGVNIESGGSATGADFVRVEGTTETVTQHFEGDAEIVDVAGYGPDVWVAVRFRNEVKVAGVPLTAPGEHLVLVRYDYEDTIRATALTVAIDGQPLSFNRWESISVDAAGNVYALIRPAGTSVKRVVSYSRSGALRWSRNLGTGVGSLSVTGNAVFVALDEAIGESHTIRGYRLKANSGSVEWTRVLGSGPQLNVGDLASDSSGFVVAGWLGVADFGAGEIHAGTGTSGLVLAPRVASYVASFTPSGALRFAAPVPARFDDWGDASDARTPSVALEPGTGRIAVALDVVEPSDHRTGITYFHADGDLCLLQDFPSQGGDGALRSGLAFGPDGTLHYSHRTALPELLGQPVPGASVWDMRSYVVRLAPPPAEK